LKRFFFKWGARSYVVALLVLLGFGIWNAYGGEGVFLRCAGTDTKLGGTTFYMCLDSTDTFHVDTFYSDTFKVKTTSRDYSDDYNFAVVTLIRDTVALADSGNDSVIGAVTVWTRDEAGYAVQLASDAPDKDLTNDTVNIRFYLNGGQAGVINKDSLFRDEVWVRTIVSDSFIAGTHVDTNYYKARYFIWLCK